MLLINVLLALAWAMLTGRFDPPDLAFGFVLGYLLLFLFRRQLGAEAYVRKFPRTIRFVLYFAWELILANCNVLVAVLLTPTAKLRPGIVAVPIDLKSDAEITMLANMITLTPGTLSLDVSDDCRCLYVHALELDDPEQFRHTIKQGFERAVHEVFEE
jgi:multicomponent Na+:H+ antiporter subunit E